MATPTAPTKPPEAPAKTELDLLKDQVAALTRELQARREPGQARIKVPAKPMAMGPWEEDVWVECLQDMVYPDPPATNDPAEIEYGVYRNGRKDGVDDKGNPTVTPGAVILLKHREHMNRYHRELSNKEVDSRPAPTPFVPQTTARSQRVRPVR